MKLLCLSDTHNKHNFIPEKYLVNPNNEISMVIHAGDMTGSGSKQEIRDFFDWYSELPFNHKIVIPGNHDWFFEEAPEYEITSFLNEYPGIIYLNDSGIEIEGYKIWGSGITPYFCAWAFNRIGDTIKQHWDLIPLDTDILVTHGPIHGYLDMVGRYNKGCPYLYERVMEMPGLRLFVCGHIHEDYGRVVLEPGNTIVINASVLDANYVMKNIPLIVDL